MSYEGKLLHFWYLHAVIITILQASHPSQALKEAHKICQKLGINHVTIQVQDAVDDNSYCVANYCKDDSNHINCV